MALYWLNKAATAMKSGMQYTKIREMRIDSPRVLGSHAFNGFNPNPHIPSQGVHLSYVAIDTDNFVRRLNIVSHGTPGRVFLDGVNGLNAEGLYHALFEHGIMDYNFTEIRMLVCHSADMTNEGISVAERLSQLTQRPVQGYYGTMTMYETMNIAGASILAHYMVNDAFMQGGAFGATAWMHHNRSFISIGEYPFPRIPNHSETFYPFY